MEGVTDRHVEKALEFLRDQSEPLANARSMAKFLDHKRKAIRGQAFSEATGTVAEREAVAESCQEYRDCLEQYRQAVYESELLSAQMRAAELKIEVWRTLAANQRRGNV